MHKFQLVKTVEYATVWSLREEKLANARMNLASL